jgi:hypothetical protein
MTDTEAMYFDFLPADVATESDVDRAALLQANAPIDVVLPANENVVRIPVIAGATIRVPFAPDDMAARLDDGNGNLAIKVGDVTVILTGYADAVAEDDVTLLASDGTQVDVAAILAATDPNLDIQTAAGPGAGDIGAGVDNSGGVFTPFDPAQGLGGLDGIGGLAPTALQYPLIQREATQTDPEEEDAVAVLDLDLAPINYNDANSGGENAPRNTNIMIVLDTSDSMGWDGNPDVDGVQARIDIAKAALANLLATYETLGDVAVSLVTFNLTATGYAWMSVSEAITLFETLTLSGWTNYQAAIEQAVTTWDTPGKIAGDADNVIYFLSDGAPNIGGGSLTHQLTPTQKAAWDSFLEDPANSIDHVYVVGISDNVEPAHATALEGVADPDGNSLPVNDIIYINDPSDDLIEHLIDTTESNSVSGNVLSGVDTSGNGDNGTAGQPDVAGDGTTHIYTFSYTGDDAGYTVEFSWDGIAASVSSTGGQNVTVNNREVSFDTEYGRMTFDFEDGSYTFVPGDVDGDTDVTFHYGTMDEDGDVDAPGGVDADGAVGGGDLVITIQDSEYEVPALALTVTSSPPETYDEAALYVA